MQSAAATPALMIPNMPMRARPAWEEQIRRVGEEPILRSLQGRNPNTLELVSTLQRRVGSVIAESGIRFNLRRTFPLFDEDTQAYFTFRPDFELPKVFTDGKPMLVETHSVLYIDAKSIHKYELFMKTYGNLYYLLLLVDTCPSVLKGRIVAEAQREVNIAHETWYLMDDPPNDGKRHPKTFDSKQIKDDVRAMLRDKFEELRIRGSAEIRPYTGDRVTLAFPAPSTL